MTFRTEPAQVALPGATISALLEAGAEGLLRLTVVVSRTPPVQPIRADEVRAEITTSGGTPLPVLSRPSGELTEAGGSNLTSANAHFQFRQLPQPPHHLSVHWRGNPARFRVLQD